MKRVLLGIFGALIFSAFGLLSQAAGAQGGLNSFRVPNYDINYTLSRDSDGRSVLKTQELIVAKFSDRNTNRGLERAIPNKYKGHTTNLNISSVLDENGHPLEYKTRTEGDMTIVRIGDPSKFVHGINTYSITYTQHDVTHFFADTGKTEWYWDTNGTGWKVPIDNLNISVALDPSIQSGLKGDPYCYVGFSGSSKNCTISAVADGIYTTKASNLMAAQNVTVAFGFESGAFTAYQKTLFERVFPYWLAAFVISIPLSIVLVTSLAVSYSRRRNRTKELSIIPVEYIPPRGVSVTTSSQIVLSSGSVFGAQLIDFAVRHYIEVIEVRAKSAWRPADYDIHVIKDVSELLAEEQEILSDMFGRLPTVGDRLSLSSLQKDYAYASRTVDNDSKLRKLITGQYEIRHPKATPIAKSYFVRWAVILTVVGIFTLMPVLLFTALIPYAMAATIRPLTDKGLELRRYLLGLSRYIKAAETERFKMLQGPDTAVKVGASVDPSDTGQLVKLYERVLPYAVLFGHEKEWTKRLGEFYVQTNQSPDWYSGTSTFNAVAFSSAISSFSYSVSSYSGSSSSSSSGGSFGGGSSGGGGGGGGGGGW